MRTVIDQYEIGDVTVLVEYAPEGPVGADHIATVSQDNWTVTRWFYYDEFSQEAVRSFAEQLIHDDEFRQSSRDKTAEWAVISERYQEAARTVYEAYQIEGLLDDTAGDQLHLNQDEPATSSLDEICERIYHNIKDNVISGDPITFNGESVSYPEYVETLEAEVRAEATSIAESNSSHG